MVQQRIDTSLDAILNSALQALEDLNQYNEVAAVGAIGAFINSVDAQRGKTFTDSEADSLIAYARSIIDALNTD